MGDQDQDTSPADIARARLRILEHRLRQPRLPTTGTPPTRTPTGAPPAAPIDLGLLDYLEQATAELTHHARAALATHPAPEPAAPPGPAADTLAWIEAATAHLAGEQALARDTLIYRQGLEHAITGGDTKVVRPIRCPACRCFGLLWQDRRRRAVCVNADCTDGRGRPSAWTLQELARQQVEIRARRAAT